MIYKHPFYVGMITTVPERECGIATFNWDFYELLKEDKRICDNGFYSIIRESLDYGPITKRHIEKEINQADPTSWEEALEHIIKETAYRKRNGIKSGFVLQHEYGLFGANHETDDNIVYLLEGLNKNNIPNITITHTILSNPDKHKEEVMKGILKNTDKVICLTPSAITILNERYGAEKYRGKLIHIPHGVPRMEIPETRNELKKIYRLVTENGLERTVISTIGFLSSGKGLEYAIDGFSQVLNASSSTRKNLVYLIAGETHPEIKRQEEEKYRNKLKKLAKEKGLKTKHICGPIIPDLQDADVVFLDKYLCRKELLKIEKMSDIGIVSNLGREQISSGQIAYWIGMGRIVIATESPYAKDMEKEGVGLLVKFENSEDIADRLKFVLNMSPREKEKLEFNASDKGVAMSWPTVANQTIDLIENIINQKYEGSLN